MTTAPAWDLAINSKSNRLAEGYRALVRSVAVDFDIDMAAELVIKATARDPISRNYVFAGQQILAPGNTVIAYMGYVDRGSASLRPLSRFTIKSEKTIYGDDAEPFVEYRGLDALHRLAEYTGPRVFTGPIFDSEIVEKLAGEHGMEAKIDASALRLDARVKGRTKKKGTSDLQFVQALAAANDYAPPYVTYDEDRDVDLLVFEPFAISQIQDTERRYVYNPSEAGSSAPSGTLEKFSCDLDLTGVPTVVEITGWDPVAQEPIVVRMQIRDGGQDSQILRGAATKAAGYKIRSGSEMRVKELKDGKDPDDKKVEAVSVPHVRTVDDAIVWASNWIRTRNRAFLQGRGVLVGDPLARAPQVHTLDGLAEAHNGRWVFTKCVHEITGEGYRTKFDADRLLEEAAEPEQE